VIRLGVIGIEGDDLGQVGRCLLKIACQRKGVRPVVQSVKVLGVPLQDLGVPFDCELVFSRLACSSAAFIVLSVSMGGRDTRSFAVLRSASANSLRPRLRYTDARFMYVFAMFDGVKFAIS